MDDVDEEIIVTDDLNDMVGNDNNGLKEYRDRKGETISNDNDKTIRASNNKFQIQTRI